MLGWIIATVCVVALVATIKRRRFYARYGHGPWFYGPPRGFRRRSLLRGLFMQLETTPGQENAIVAALDDAFERCRPLTGELAGVRREVGALIASDALDHSALDAVIGRQRDKLELASDALARMLERIHEVLDDQQRRELGALIAEGSLGASVARGYRHRRGCGSAFGY